MQYKDVTYRFTEWFTIDWFTVDWQSKNQSESVFIAYEGFLSAS